MSNINERWRKFLHEASEEEIGHLDDVLDVPVEDYPFSNIFEDKYRIISKFKAESKLGEISEVNTMLDKQGWGVDWNDPRFRCSKPFTKFWTGKDGKMNSKDVVETMALGTLLSKMTSAMETIGERYEKVKNTEDKTAQLKLIHALNQSYRKLFGDTLLAIRVTTEFPFDSVLTSNPVLENHFLALAQIHLTSKRSLKTSLDKVKNLSDWLAKSTTDLRNNLDSYLTETYYMILSRHPIDVFRMSDHQKITSCHAPPSSGYKGQMSQYDDYNICALAEAHANGMIAYAITESEFNRAGIKPTQEELDKYGENEIFRDRTRGADGIEPVSRMRVKFMSYDDGKEQINFAIPQTKVYGDKLPGFIEHLFSVLKPPQQAQVAKLLELEGGELDFEKFTKYGGTYEDTGYESDHLLLTFVNEFTKVNVSGHGSVNHETDLEQSLKASFGDPLDEIRLRLHEIEEEMWIQDFSQGLHIQPNFDVDDDGYISLEFGILFYIYFKPSENATSRSLTLAITDAMDEAGEMYGLPDADQVILTPKDDEEDKYEVYVSYKHDHAERLIGLGDTDIPDVHTLEQDIMDAYYGSYPAPNLIAKFSSSRYVNDSVAAYLEAWLQKNGYSKGTDYAVEEFTWYVEGNRDSMWEIEDVDYDDNQFFGEIPYSVTAVHQGGLEFWPVSDYLEEAGYGDMKQVLAERPDFAEHVQQVLKFEVVDYFRALGPEVMFDPKIDSQMLITDDGVQVHIAFQVNQDQSDNVLAKLQSIKTLDYDVLRNSLITKCLARTKQLKEKYERLKAKEAEKQLREQKKQNKLKVKIRKR